MEKEVFLDKLKKLVALGKSKQNALDATEINDFFAGDNLGPEQMDEIYNYLEHNNIDVVPVGNDGKECDLSDAVNLSFTSVLYGASQKIQITTDNANLAAKLGVNGAQEVQGQDAKVTGSVHTGAIFVDGLGVGDVGNIVLRDRQHLSEDGIMIVVMTLERHSNVVLAGPDIVSRGFVYVRESEDLMEHARQVVETALDSCLENNITDWGKIKTEVKDALGEYLWKRTKRNPMILPIIMEA